MGILIDNISRVNLVSIREVCTSNMTAEVNKNLRLEVEYNCPWINHEHLPCVTEGTASVLSSVCLPSLSVTRPGQGSDPGKNTQTADYPQRSLTIFSLSSLWGQHPKWWICWRGLIKGYFRKEGNFHKIFDKSCCLVTKSDSLPPHKP